MKNVDIHQGFANASIRDFLAQEHEIASRQTFGRSSQDIEEEINTLQEKLQFAKRYEATLELAQSRGWQFWDVSDDVEDWDFDSYMSFLGTEEEYDSLIATLRICNHNDGAK